MGYPGAAHVVLASPGRLLGHPGGALAALLASTLLLGFFVTLYGLRSLLTA